MRAVESLKEDRCWPGSETRPGARHRRHFNPAQAAVEALDEGILLWWQSDSELLPRKRRQRIFNA